MLGITRASHFPPRVIEKARLGLQVLGDSGIDRSRRGGRRVTLNDLTILVHQKLFKVPLDTLETQQTGLLVLEVGVDGVGVSTIDIDLLENGEGDAVVELAEGLNLILGTRLLVGKLVAGEAKNHEALGAVLLVELLESLVLGSETALGSNVDNENNLALELRKFVGIASLVKGGKRVKLGFAHFRSIISFG